MRVFFFARKHVVFAILALVTRTFPDHSIVFVRTKKDCQRMHIILGLLGVKVSEQLLDYFLFLPTNRRRFNLKFSLQAVPYYA